MSISEYPPLVQWIKGLSMFTQKACSATRKTASIKSRKQGQREGPKHDSSAKASFNYNSCNCVQELVSVHQLSGYIQFMTGFKPPDNYNWLCCWNGNEEATNQQPSTVFVDSFTFCYLFRGIESRRDRASRSSENASSLDSTERRKYPLTRRCER